MRLTATLALLQSVENGYKGMKQFGGSFTIPFRSLKVCVCVCIGGAVLSAITLRVGRVSVWVGEPYPYTQGVVVWWV